VSTAHAGGQQWGTERGDDKGRQAEVRALLDARRRPREELEAQLELYQVRAWPIAGVPTACQAKNWEGWGGARLRR